MRTAVAIPLSANERFKRRADSWIWKSIILAAGLHFAVFAFGPRMGVAEDGRSASDPVVIVEPPDAPLPPPPEPITRPVAPIVSTTAPVDAVIPPLDFDTYVPAPSAPPPAAAGDGAAEFRRWTPSMTIPALRNPEAVERALAQRYPALLRDAGLGGVVQIRLWIDENGGIVRSELAESSGYDAMDRAALGVIDLMRLTPAVNNGRAVRVIVTLPLRFEAR